MFKQVRLKLTLINIAVVGVILIVFLSGIFILMQKNTRNEALQQLRAASSEIRIRQQRPSLQPPGRRFRDAFYIRFDSDGNILDQTQNLPVTDSELNALVDSAIMSQKDMGTVKPGTEAYRFIRSFSPDLRDMTIVFLSTQSERETLTRLGTILISVGLAGIVIVFLSSLFLAERALIPIKKSWERQQNFVADASHELRSPLAVIQTSLELVLGNREETVESQTKWLENIRAENRRMTKLVNDLLFLARADSNQQALEKTMFPLQQVVKKVADTYEPLVLKKNIRLELKLADEVLFFGDENRLKQVAVILLDNAIKYTPAGGKVEVGLKQSESNVELTVADTGEGIGSEHLDKIFGRFYRVDKARSRDSGGTGLGLSIADWIVKEHKGTITVASAPGKGSTFKVTLPKFLHRS
jgi:signal transduction histidine kinase